MAAVENVRQIKNVRFLIEHSFQLPKEGCCFNGCKNTLNLINHPGNLQSPHVPGLRREGMQPIIHATRTGSAQNANFPS